jgi:chaperonin cofactor prefoldin
MEYEYWSLEQKIDRLERKLRDIEERLLNLEGMII